VNLNPTSNDWNTAAQLDARDRSYGPNDTATFDVSNTTNINVSGIEVNSITFTPGASAYTLTIRDSDMTISGVGITNNFRAHTELCDRCLFCRFRTSSIH